MNRLPQLGAAVRWAARCTALGQRDTAGGGGAGRPAAQPVARRWGGCLLLRNVHSAPDSLALAIAHSQGSQLFF